MGVGNFRIGCHHSGNDYSRKFLRRTDCHADLQELHMSPVAIGLSPQTVLPTPFPGPSPGVSPIGMLSSDI